MSAGVAERVVYVSDVIRNEFNEAADQGKKAGERFLVRLDADSLPDALFAKVANYYEPAADDLQPRLRAFCRQVQMALVERGPT